MATLQGLQRQQRELAENNNPPQVPQADVLEDPAYDGHRLRLPITTSFPVPCTGRVQCMTFEVLARLPTLACRDQKKANFVLNMTADLPTLDDEGKSIVYQRLYLYALVAAYGWPKAIAATNAVAGDAVPLPPGMTPITAARRGRSQQGRRDAPQQQQQQRQPQQRQQRERGDQRRN